jgi:hypothetical protein
MSRRVALVAAGVLFVIGIPLAGKWARQDSAPRCAGDGVRIEARYRVRVVDHGGRSHEFCCPRCAAEWIAGHPGGAAAVYVADETSGEEVEAGSAWFVHSRLVTDPVTGNRVRAFRDRAAAEEHVRAFGGRVLDRSEGPFRRGWPPAPK